MAAHTDLVLAKATGSFGGLGKVAALASTETVYVRCDCSRMPCKYVDWNVQTTAKTDLGFYVARSAVDKVTLTLASFTDGDTIKLNGLTITGESTAADAAFASRKFSTAGATDTDDAAELAKLINADYAVVTAGTSVAATDKLIITTDEGEHTIVAAATADYPNSKYGLNATAATELASIVLAINHKHTVTCASVAAGDYFTIQVNGELHTFTAKTGSASAANRQFSKDTGNNETAASIVTVVNDATYGVPGITASANGAVVSFTRDAQAYKIQRLTSSSATKLAVADAGGVPGVVAAATGATAELAITPTWTKKLTVTEAGDKLTVTGIDVPGIYATSASAVVTLTPGTPAGTSGDMASLIQASASAHCTISQAATLLGLRLVSAAGTAGSVQDMAANNTTEGTIYTVPVNGYEQAYLSVYADGTTPTIVITATKRS